jgi:hypothetical protein
MTISVIILHSVKWLYGSKYLIGGKADKYGRGLI